MGGWDLLLMWFWYTNAYNGVMPNSLLDLLAVGDMRTTGNVDAVVTEVLANHGLLDSLVAAIEHEDRGVRMRAADALEKISRSHPELVQAYKRELLSILDKCSQQEVQWHVAQLLPRLTLTKGEAMDAYALLLRNYRLSESRIVKTWSLQAMADLTERLPEKRRAVRQLAEEAARSGTAAMKSRAKKILKQMG